MKPVLPEDLAGLAPDQIHAEHRRLLEAILTGLQFASPRLESVFRAWLHGQAMMFLRAHVPYLAGLFVLLATITFVYVYWFAEPAFRAHDLKVWLWISAAQGGLTFIFCYCARKPALDGWFWLYSGLTDVFMLVLLSLAAMLAQDNTLYQIAQALLVVGFVVIFGTGMQRLLPCVGYAGLAAVLVAAIAGLFGLEAGFGRIAAFYGVVFFGMSLLCSAMERTHRVVFLQQCLLEQDRLRLSVQAGHLAELSRQDALTELANRRRFDESLAEAWERARRGNEPLSLLFIDVDHFKHYNDTLGHQAGDACLRQLAGALHAVPRRASDLVARYGGEEFVLLLPNTAAKGALYTAERVLKVAAALDIPHEGVPAGHITVSIGLATAMPRDGGSPSALLETADRALYEAKARGRNRLVIASALSPEVGMA